MHHCQQPRSQQLRELPRVASVGLHAIAGPARDQRRRDHLAVDALGLEPTLQREAAGPGLVAGDDRARRRALEATG